MAQPNFELVKRQFYQTFVNSDNATKCILLEGMKSKNFTFRESFNKREQQFKKDFNLWLDRIDIRQSGELIDEILKVTTKIPSWMKHKKYSIDYNESCQLDLIKQNFNHE